MSEPVTKRVHPPKLSFYLDHHFHPVTVEGVVKMDYLGRRVLRELNNLDGAVAGGADFLIKVAIDSGSNTKNEKDGDMNVGSTVASDDMSSGVFEYGTIQLSVIIVLMTAIGMGLDRFGA